MGNGLKVTGTKSFNWSFYENVLRWSSSRLLTLDFTHYAPFILKKLGATWKWFLGWSKFSKACQGSKIRFIKKNPKKIASVKKYGQKTRFRPFLRISPKAKKGVILWILDFLGFFGLNGKYWLYLKGLWPYSGKKIKIGRSQGYLISQKYM